MLNRLKAAFTYLRFNPWVEQPVWKKDDAVALQAFFQTPTGVKLEAYLRNYVLISQRNAVISQANRDFECGSANGAAIAVHQLSQLANADQFPAEEGDSPAPSDE